MITFRVLGTIDLRGEDGRHLGSGISGSKRIGLLAYLAVAGRRGLPQRDTLLGLFWPEMDQKRARNSLSNMLHQIRLSLGPDALLVRGSNQIGLAPELIWCDAPALEDALDAGRFREALDLYRGDLLDGFFVSDASPELEHWLDAERARLRRRVVDAARELTNEAEREDNVSEAARWARTAHALDPFDEASARRLILLLGASGDRADAIRAYEDFARRLAREFGAEPSAETRAALDAVRGTQVPRAASSKVDPHSRALVGDLRRSGATEREDGDVLPVRSVAVLPFESLSANADAEPFALGLHDDLLTELSRISALSVIARTSVMRYRGTDRSVQEIARELGVGTVVEGGVQVVGGRLRLNVQVIDGASGSHRWAERYDRELSMGTIFDLQGELAEKIARAVRARLTPTEMERGVQLPPAALEAYRLYAQGRAYLDQRTEAGMRRSVDYFERALKLDPAYALAWVGLSDALTLLRDYGYETADRVLPRAEDAVHHALALHPALAEAYASLGLLHSNRREGSAALRALRRAVRLRPGYAEAHNWLSWNSLVLGLPEQALESSKRAVELDPLSPEAVCNLSWSYLLAGDGESGLREARRVRDLSPDWPTGPFAEAANLYHLGRYADAIALLTGLTVEWAGSGPRITLALAHVASGDEIQGRELLREFEGENDPYAVGLIRLSLGETGRALETLGAVDRWDYWTALSMHHFYPRVLHPLRESPLYHRMRREMDAAWGHASGGD